MDFVLAMFLAFFGFGEPTDTGPADPSKKEVSSQSYLGSPDECLNPPEAYIDGIVICPLLVSPA